jgi:hypothetical protein
MTRCLLTAALLALAGLDVGAAEKPAPLTPEWAFARIEGPNRIVLETFRFEVQVRTVVLKTDKDGKVIESRTENVLVPVQSRQMLDLQGVQAFTPDGKRVPPKEVAERLEKGAGVVVLPVARPLDPAFRALLKDDALILVSPPAPGPVPPRPLPEGRGPDREKP